MTDLLLRGALSNACVALGVAVIAVVVGAAVKRPQLTNLLWLLVLVKLITPPILTLPILPVLAQPTAVVGGPSWPDATAPGGREGATRQGQHDAGDCGFGIPRSGPEAAGQQETAASVQRGGDSFAGMGSVALSHGVRWLPAAWLLGGAVVLVGSLARVFRFDRLLGLSSKAAPPDVQDAAKDLARRLGLRRVPAVCTTPGRLSPMVWWAGGKVRVVLPTPLLERMDARQWRWVLAHELAHVRRRDYLVRWIEWLACVGFWWNPVMWWARRNLRASEELCCDALVLSCLSPKPRTYAKSLLAAVEFLARPALRPPATASEVNSGGFLERRFEMIVSHPPNRPNPRWLRACVLLCAAVVLPLGVARGQDFKRVAKRLDKAVEKGEVTRQQADVMMGALRKSAAAGKTGKSQQGDPARANAYLEKVWAELQAAVKAGKISQEDAHRKMAEIKREVHAKLKGERGHKEGEGDDKGDWLGLESLGRKLKAAVEKGEITEKQAWAKWHGYKEKVVAPRLKAAVKAGKISEEEARGIWGGIERAEIAEKLKSAVAKGEMTEQEARAKWAEITGEDGGEEKKGKEEGDLEALGRKLRAAVEAGEMSEDDAKAEWGAAVTRWVGRALTQEAAKIDRPQVKVHADPSRSIGVPVPEHGGLLLVPQAGINEDDAPDMTVPNGVPLGLLFASAKLVPVVDGERVGRGTLHQVVLTDGEGRQHQANCILLAVRQVSDDDYRLYGFGKSGKPILDVRITDAEAGAPQTMPLALELNESDDGPAEVVITIFGKYQARFHGGVAE